MLAIGVAVVGFLADLGSKTLVLRGLDPTSPIPLLGGLVTLQLTRNSGAAFSMGGNFTVVFSCVAIVAFVGVVIFLLPRIRHVGWAVGTGLLLAGIAGNLADRLFREPSPFHGHVIDFIWLRHFAIFNVADMCITAAAIIIIWLTIITQVAPSGVSMKAEKPREGQRG